MKERTCFLTRRQSAALRGVAILMVLASHYIHWYGDLIPNEGFCYGVSRLGIYGVDLFFLVSGYGLAKSAARKRPGLSYWKNRLKNMYVPYLVLAGIIELSSGGLLTARSWYIYLTGYDYWYIRSALIFYLLFFVVFRYGKNRDLRAVWLGLGVLIYSGWLFWQGRADFWYLSNAAFVLGVWAQLYEKQLLRAAQKGYALQLAVLSVLLFLAAKSGVDGRFVLREPAAGAVRGTLASVVWTVFCLQAAALLPVFFGILDFLGEISLELYLSHLFLFYREQNAAWTDNRVVQGGTAFLLAVLVSWLFNRAFRFAFRAPEERTTEKERKK